LGGCGGPEKDQDFCAAFNGTGFSAGLAGTVVAGQASAALPTSSSLLRIIQTLF